MMKIKQTCEITADIFHCHWSGLSISDANGNEVDVKLTDRQWLELAEKMSRKVNRLRSNAAEDQYKEDMENV